MTPKLPVILLVDDDANDGFFFEQALQSTDTTYSLARAFNGQEAIDHMLAGASESQTVPSLIITDLSMPIMDGFYLLEWLKQQAAYKDIPVLVLSSSMLENDVRRAYELGAAGFITKSARYENLVKLARSLDAFFRRPSADVTELVALPGWQCPAT